MKRWTSEEIENLVSEYTSGQDTGELAIRYNCSKAIIRN